MPRNYLAKKPHATYFQGLDKDDPLRLQRLAVMAYLHHIKEAFQAKGKEKYACDLKQLREGYKCWLSKWMK